jgi:hypothetical protein
MALRPSIAVVLLGATASLGASWPTPNFIVEAPDPAFAKQIGEYAEHYRRQKALEWLGQEMPTWGRRCPLRVSISGSSGGATEFGFDNGSILSITMHIEGSADRLLASVLPHEITHTVLAYYFRTPVPRWADEGSAVLSEDDRERAVHEQTVWQILHTPGRAIPLRRLFSLKEYPRDPSYVMALYAQGYSVTNFLVGQSDRRVFLAFVAQGMQNNGTNWDAALRTHYRYRNIEELEGAWVQYLRNGRQQPAQLASNRGAGNWREAGPAARQVVLRQTAPPAQPILEAPQPVYRGQIPDEPAPSAAPGWDRRPAGPPQSDPRPGYYHVPPPPSVRLEAPEFERVPPATPQWGSQRQQ